MLCKEVQHYIEKGPGLPFFYAVGDAGYAAALEELRTANLEVIRMSAFCGSDDKFPGVDALVDELHTGDTNYRGNRFVVIGIGECLALQGAAVAERELQRLKNVTLGNARAVLLLRGVSGQVEELLQSDNKLAGQHREYHCGDLRSGIRICNVTEGAGFVAQAGMRRLLRKLEDGACGEVYASTKLLLDNSLFPQRTLCGAHAVIRLLDPDFALEEELGTAEQWKRLLEEMRLGKQSVADVLDAHEVSAKLQDNFRLMISGTQYDNWLAFLWLKLHAGQIDNSYLKLAVKETGDFRELRRKLTLKIIDFRHSDPDFRKLCEQRKRLLRGFRDAELSEFVQRNEVDPEESIWRLTDTTMLERQAIVKWIARHGIQEEAIAFAWPDLAAWLRKYVFDCPEIGAELTHYFDEYKRQKLENAISEDFMALVEEYADQALYARLETRDNVLKNLPDKDSTFLYWIDALGLEHLSYITELARQHNLSMQVEIASANLPTITSFNRSFFDAWPEERRYKEDALDEIKHKAKGGYYFTKDQDPIHIPAELEVLRRAIDTAAMELGKHSAKCKSFLIVGDHGASRLAVIHRQEVPYDTDTKGEHSGRCCKEFPGCNVPHAIRDNGYIILSDYGRFRKSRAANVEVHGGASLEEVIVPVITLKLRQQGEVHLQLLHEDAIVADKREGVTLELFISFVEYPEDVRIVIGETSYAGEPEDGTHFRFALRDITKSRKRDYEAAVFDGANRIGSIRFHVHAKTAKIKDDFDFGDEF